MQNLFTLLTILHLLSDLISDWIMCTLCTKMHKCAILIKMYLDIREIAKLGVGESKLGVERAGLGVERAGFKVV